MSQTWYQKVQTTILRATVIFVVLNAFTLDLGWGGRRDHQPGHEIERRFGWPVCFYCDLWRSDHDHPLNLPAYMPLIPFSREMNFDYWNGSLVGYLFNQTFVACAVGVYLILIAAEDRRPSVWQIGLGIGLSIIALLIYQLGQLFNSAL